MTGVAPDWTTFDRPQSRLALLEVDGGAARAQLLIEGMHCGNCALSIERAVGALAGVTSVSVNPATHHARVGWDLERLPFSAILRTIAGLGFEPHVVGAHTDTERAVLERRKAYKRLAVAGLGMMQVMTYAFGLYAGAIEGIEAQYELYLRIASMFVTLPVVLYSAAPFFANAWSDLRARRLGMDLPVSLAIGLAFAASVFNSLRGVGEVYFDSVTMFVFFLLLGRMVEMQTRHHAGTVSEALMRVLPASAMRRRNGRIENVAAQELQAGDTVIVAAGGVVPADGLIIEGSSTLDESLLTGEAAAVPRSVGHSVIGGGLNLAQPLTLRLTAVGQATVLSGIVRLLERAQAERPRMARAADRAAGHFIAAILAASVVVGVVWFWLDPPRAFPAVLAVLVVTCPCALSLATPAAIAAATSRFARLGLLVARTDAIETLARVRHCIMDKTGTLTTGKPHVVHVHLLSDRDEAACRSLAAALEQSSDHPLATAFADARIPTVRIGNARVDPGQGVQGEVDGETHRIGTEEYVAALAGPAPAGTPAASVYLGAPGCWLAAFALDDTLRSDAAGTVQALRDLGIGVEIASGDQAAAVRRVADAVGVTRFGSRLTPQDKLARVRAAIRECGAVLMVGDGLNDAPVLGAASVSVAMGKGSALAQVSADLVLTGEGLSVIAEGIAHARRALGVVRQNLAWATAYNLVAIPLAAMGWIAPWAAAIGMSLSSIIVVLNARRLARAPRRGARPTSSRWLGSLQWPACCC